MKNTTQLLALGLVLFLGSCSVVEDKFLDKVKGKKFFSTATGPTVRGEFSEDGRSLDIYYKFVEASDESTGKYQAKLDANNNNNPVMVTSTIKITGAETLTITYTWPGQDAGTDKPVSFHF